MKRLLLLSPILAIAGTGHGQMVHSFSMEEAMDYAANHSYAIVQSNVDVAVSQSKVKETTAIGLPQLSAEGTFNNYINIPTQVVPADAFTFPGMPPAEPGAVTELQFGNKYNVTGGINASQLIFDGSYFIGLKASKAYLDYALLGREKTQIDVRNDVAQTYFNALAAEENIAAIRDNLKNMEVIFSETNAMYEAGFLEKLDADQVRLLRSNIENQLEYAENQRRNVVNLLKFQMGIPVSDSVVLTDSLETMVELQTSENLEMVNRPLDLESHIDYRTISMGATLSKLSMQNEKARYYPRLSAFFTHSENLFSNEFEFFGGNAKWYPTTIWGLNLSVPIFTSFMTRQKVRQAKFEMERLESQKVQIAQSLQMQNLNARANYTNSLERYITEKENLELAEEIVNTTRIKYNEGLASSTDLTQAENQYVQTLGNYINTTLQLFNAKIELERSLGI